MSNKDAELPPKVQGPPDLPGRSFLTDAQRQFLASDGEEYSTDTRRQYRYQIRQNFQSALIDLQAALIMSDRDQALAVKPVISSHEYSWDPDEIEGDLTEHEPLRGAAMLEGLSSLIAWYILHIGDETRLENLIEEGFEQATELVEDEDVGEYSVSVTRKPSDS
jgi:hypothetical protein